MLGIMSRYIKDDNRVGMGTLMATQMPFAFWFLIAWGGWLIVSFCSTCRLVRERRFSCKR